MSRLYIFQIMIPEALTSSVCSDLEDALEAECFQEITWSQNSRRASFFRAEGKYNLGSGRSVEEETARLQNLIWEIVGEYVTIKISAVYMEPDMISATYADYEKWIAGGGKPRPRCKCGKLADEYIDDQSKWSCLACI